MGRGGFVSFGFFFAMQAWYHDDVDGQARTWDSRREVNE